MRSGMEKGRSAIYAKETRKEESRARAFGMDLLRLGMDPPVNVLHVSWRYRIHQSRILSIEIFGFRGSHWRKSSQFRSHRRITELWLAKIVKKNPCAIGRHDSKNEIPLPTGRAISCW